MATVTSTYDRMSLRQLTELEYILLGDLRDVLEEDSTEENRKWLRAVVEALLKTVPREFALREQGGYLREIVMLSPELDAQVRQLRNEHVTLYVELKQLADSLGSCELFKARSVHLKQGLEDWMQHLMEHNRHEEMLVQQAYQQDTGGGD